MSEGESAPPVPGTVPGGPPADDTAAELPEVREDEVREPPAPSNDGGEG